MNNESFSQTFEFLKSLIENDPKNGKLIDLLNLLIQKKSEFDMQNNQFWFQSCMQNNALNYHWRLITNGYQYSTIQLTISYLFHNKIWVIDNTHRNRSVSDN